MDTHTHTLRDAQRHKHISTQIQTNRDIDKNHGQTHKQTHTQTYTDTETTYSHRHTQKQTSIETDKHTYTDTHRHTHVATMSKQFFRYLLTTGGSDPISDGSARLPNIIHTREDTTVELKRTKKN